MSADPRLFIWPKGADVAAVKAVVEDLVPELGYKVKPFWYDVATSEDVERVLVLADGFENAPVVDYIYPKTTALTHEAVEWSLGLRESRGARLAIDTMRRIFGQDLVMREEREERDEYGEWGIA